MEVFLIKAFQLIVALSLLVVVHEFGHYLFARLFKIRVEKFYLFFNPRFSILRYVPERGRLELGTWMDKEGNPHPLAGLKVGKDYEGSGKKVPAWKQTIYGIGWIPLGGYCAIAGMIDETQDASKLSAEPQRWEFRSKPAWQRLLVMCGGVIFNFLAAIIIYIGISYSWGQSNVRFRDAYAGMEYSPVALNAGFENGDIPLMADGKEVESDTPNVVMVLSQANKVTVLRNRVDTVNVKLPHDFLLQLQDDGYFFRMQVPVVVIKTLGGTPAAHAGIEKGDRIVAVGDVPTPTVADLKPALQKYAGKETEIKVERNGKTLTLTATPDDDATIGIHMAQRWEDIYPVYYREYTLLQAIPAGWRLGVSTLSNYVTSMSQVFSKKGAQSLGGFGALGDMFPELWDWQSFWFLTAFLSVALAFMNILPIPALDGGHVLFLLYEVVTRRRPSDRFMEVAQSVGFFFLLALLLLANFNDVMRFIK